MISKLLVCFSYCINWRSILLFLDSFGDGDDSSYHVEIPSEKGDFCPQDTPAWSTILHQGSSNWECMLSKLIYFEVSFISTPLYTFCFYDSQPTETFLDLTPVSLVFVTTAVL